MEAASTASTMDASSSMTGAFTLDAAHAVRTDRAASSMEGFATISSVESFASMESPVGAHRHYTTTGEAAVVGMARPVVHAVIDVIVVMSFMMLPITKVLPITVPPVGKVVPIVVPIAKMTEVSIKIVVEVTEEENGREAHVKR